jgi:ketosteroid isomerase-like protein
MKDEGRGLLLFILHPSSFIPRAWGEFMADAVAKELLGLNQLLLDAIVTADWDKYQDLCDESLTCFEPEALGQLVQGLDFHQFYFKLGAVTGNHCTTMASPHVRVMGDVAVVSYIRLNQRVTGDGSPVTRPVEETRVWQKQKGRWKHVHFHRSVPAKP